MALSIQDNIVDNAATITVTATTPIYTRPDSNRRDPRVAMLVYVGSNPTGTTPTLDYQLQSSMDGTVWHNVGSSQHFTASGNARVETAAIEPYWQIVKTIGGSASPTFTNVTSHLVFLKD